MSEAAVKQETKSETKPAQVFPYTKTKRFAVVKRLPFEERFRANFKWLHESRESAEAEAIRLAEKFNEKFYVIEIQTIASNQD